MFNRTDFVNSLAYGMDNWYRANRQVSLRVAVLIAGSTQHIGPKDPWQTAVSAGIQKQAGDSLTKWTLISIDVDAPGAGDGARAFEAALSWAQNTNGNLANVMPGQVARTGTRVLLGDANLETFTNNTCIAKWNLLGLQKSSAKALPDELQIVGGRMLLTFNDPATAGCLYLTRRLSFKPLKRTTVRYLARLPLPE